jgi:hypothetical protein
MADFRSNDDLFQEVRSLIARLEASGRHHDAETLREGFGCLNGLTDGWALFLKSIREVEDRSAKGLPADERKALRAIRRAAHALVHRR